MPVNLTSLKDLTWRGKRPHLLMCRIPFPDDTDKEDMTPEGVADFVLLLECICKATGLSPALLSEDLICKIMVEWEFTPASTRP